MFDWSSFTRDLQERSIFYPIHAAYGKFMDIKRYDHFPFYIYPQGKALSSFEDSVLKFIDHLVDGHELERNKSDFNRSFYYRANYVARNFHRYQNDTMANLMFDTKLRSSDYDRMNSVIGMQNGKFYVGTSLLHMTILAYSTYFFRYRTLSKLQVLAVGTAYYYAFNSINSIAYKTIVDRKVIQEARALGQDSHVQPNGSFKNRGLNY